MTITVGLLAGATVMEAFSDAQENEPDNHFIQSLLETGYGPITLVDYKAPKDVVVYFIQFELNERHCFGNFSCAGLRRMCHRSKLSGKNTARR